MDNNLIYKLREETNAGVMDCKRALQEAGGDYAKAKEILKKQGQDYRPRGGVAKEGRIGIYLHSTGKGGAMLELSCETDFVAKNEAFQRLLQMLTLAVYGFDPVSISKDDLPKELIAAEMEKCQDAVKGKPPAIADKIIAGKLEKDLYSKKCLLHIPYPIEEEFKGTFGDFLKSKVAILKENITVKRFHRMEVGK